MEDGKGLGPHSGGGRKWTKSEQKAEVKIIGKRLLRDKSLLKNKLRLI